MKLKFDNIVIGADYESVKWAHDNGAAIVYDSIQYPEWLDYEGRREIDDMLFDLSFTYGSAFQVIKDAVEILPRSSLLKFHLNGEDMEVRYEKLRVHNDSPIYAFVEDDDLYYDDDVCEYRIIYDFLIRVGNFRLENTEEFDFDDFGYSFVPEYQERTNGFISNTVAVTSLRDVDRYKVVEDTIEWIKIRDAEHEDMDIRFCNTELNEVNEWKKIRFSRVSSEHQGIIKSMSNFGKMFSSLYVVFTGTEERYGEVKSELEKMMCEMINNWRVHRDVDLFEISVEKIRPDNVSIGLRNFFNRYKNISVV
jgi:hypothetical protein